MTDMERPPEQRSATSTAIVLPVQRPPVSRTADHGRVLEGGVEASQTACSGLTGLARQMCYATQYGVSV